MYYKPLCDISGSVAFPGDVTIKIPGYKIERLIAEGGMATVYLATQESLGRYVALKLLRKFDNANQSKRFLIESQIIAALNHRNIITIYDIGVTDDKQPYISMEYLEGGDLEARIERGMDPKDALHVVEEIGDCLSLVHREGIIHRDIKPANILFHKNGTPILSDFGIAKQEDKDTRLTMDGSALGSPYYLSPEQAECETVDGRADIYGLGIVLYEMLTGKKPYKGNSHIETIVAHLSDALPILPPELSQYQDLVNKMIAKSPDDRFSNAGVMVHYIRLLQETETDSSSRILDNKVSKSLSNTGIIQQAQQLLKTNTKVLWASAGILALLLIITGTLIWMQQPATVDSTENAADSESTIYDAAVTEEPEPLSRETPVISSHDSLRIEAILLKADLALEESRLILPKNDNAYYYYKQILEVYPNHGAAIIGMEKIANAYADLAENEINRFNYLKATRYIRKGLRIQPDNDRLLDLEENTNVLKDAPKRAFDKIKKIFK